MSGRLYMGSGFTGIDVSGTPRFTKASEDRPHWFSISEIREATGHIQPRVLRAGEPVVHLRAGGDTEAATTIAERLREGLP
jgi:hypothetical protein